MLNNHITRCLQIQRAALLSLYGILESTLGESRLLQRSIPPYLSGKSTEERSDKDTFMTSHSVNLDDITTRMNSCVADLEAEGFYVWRSKREDTDIDIKYNRNK